MTPDSLKHYFLYQDDFPITHLPGYFLHLFITQVTAQQWGSLYQLAFHSMSSSARSSISLDGKTIWASVLSALTLLSMNLFICLYHVSHVSQRVDITVPFSTKIN